jgi:hypothetical protein
MIGTHCEILGSLQGCHPGCYAYLQGECPEEEILNELWEVKDE